MARHGYPAQDPIGTVRIRYRSERHELWAQRVIKIAGSWGGWTWLTGRPLTADLWLSPREVAGWPVQSWSELARVLGHPGDEGADRGRLHDLDEVLAEAGIDPASLADEEDGEVTN
ncbi:hypothetical protein [Pseudonocardia asaccharolytica]|uniref:Uncharacterized protein n=1 Tax=Pseudonocardia asaccharolytica DSM 44247 = NBRC 16224 TaxID=1123024 RepID=A0A511D3F7_9PSEU|nr:hypothetical protein [Pseudonocardia asaccharolytica]GEL19305.1 hypothetical protein PA7_31420 [Pseudonocardia asaccharolytica DSM 44247 = NBRC 16224]